MTWHKTPPTGRVFALCYYENDPNYRHYRIGQWDPNYGWWLDGNPFPLHKTDQIVWTELPCPPEGIKLDRRTWMIDDYK